MNTLEDLEHIFNILHDGDLELINIKEDTIFLKANCQYLAELIKPNFLYFYLSLKGYHSITFETWHLDLPEKSIEFKGVEEAFGEGIGILNAEIENNFVKIYSDIRYGEPTNDGGILTIGTDNYEIFDQEKRRLNLNNLKALSKKYWHDFGA